jgi:hypothetical protein
MRKSVSEPFDQQIEETSAMKSLRSLLKELDDDRRILLDNVLFYLMRSSANQGRVEHLTTLAMMRSESRRQV